MRILYKNSPPFNLMRASFTDHYELRTDHFINFGNSTYFVIVVSHFRSISFMEMQKGIDRKNIVFYNL